MFGGHFSRTLNQISKVEDCTLKRIADLPFYFEHGACTMRQEKIFLCFDFYDDGRTCHFATNPLGPWEEVSEKAIFHHADIRIAASDCKSLNALL